MYLDQKVLVLVNQEYQVVQVALQARMSLGEHSNRIRVNGVRYVIGNCVQFGPLSPSVIVNISET